MISHPWEIALLLLVAIAEFMLSWLNHRINFYTLTKKKWKASQFDVIANTLSEVIPYFIYVVSQNWIYILPRILANTFGTFWAASRRPKSNKKKVYKKKMPFSTA